MVLLILLVHKVDSFDDLRCHNELFKIKTNIKKLLLKIQFYKNEFSMNLLWIQKSSQTTFLIARTYRDFT